MKLKYHNLKLLCLTLLLMIGASGLYAVDPTGVTVNGVEVAEGAPPSAGWNYDSSTSKLTIDGAGPFTISGKNTSGKVCVVVSADVTTAITLSNLTLWATSNDRCAFALETNANVSLFLKGKNSLKSATNRAGLEVPAEATLSITHAPDDTEGALSVFGGYYGAGIGSGNNVAAGTIIINGGAVAAQGGSYAAGIGGGGGYSTAGSLTVNGGEVVAMGGSGSAGIGGGGKRSGGTVIITGGSVTAEGGDYGAGIGGGGSFNSGSGAGGTVTISGGRVVAHGSVYAAGIGGGGGYNSGGNGGTVAISGGTVIAQGNGGGADIGPGKNNNNGSENTFTGGSISLAASSALPAPTNDVNPVGCAVVSGFNANTAVTITGLSDYGVNDIFADNYGSIYLWLPDGTYTFDANERNCTVEIQGGVGPTGITVNDEEVAFGPSGGAGWNFDADTQTLTLSGAGPFTLSGGNPTGAVCVFVPDDFNNTITLSNLTILSRGNNQCAFALGQNANVSLLLTGNNRLGSGENQAGLEVATGQTLSINNVSGDEAATLTVTGGIRGAGIGGGKDAAAGTITIAGGAITATGGNYGAGVGGGYKGAGGNVSVSGGSLTATGGYYGTGIGGGGGGDSYNSVGGAGGSLTISGGTVVATGDRSAAGVGGGQRQAGGTVNITGGSLTATGGGNGGAGIGSGGNYTSGTDGTVNISDGQVTATGDSGAGIGGGSGSTGSAVTISGGTIIAQSSSGAGIGGGYNATNDTVTISGGKVIAQSGGGAGIGGGYKGAGSTVSIAGGTVFTQSNDGEDIGSGSRGAVAETNTFTGGSIRLANSSITSAPTNGTDTVGCAVVTGFEPDEAVAIDGLSPYGINDIVADETGALYLWLPNGTYTFTANGRECTVKIQDGAGNTGVFVNGKEVAFGPDDPAEGWSYDASTSTLKLSGTGPFSLSGSSLNSSVSVVVPESVSNQITLSNLTLRAAGSNQCAFALDTLAVVSLFLEGTNKLTSGSGRAGLEVTTGRTITIDHAPDDATGSLTATSGYNAAGIGGASGADAGTININSGIVTALGGGNFASGIGGGASAGAGTINISGGTVTATAGDFAAGIGTGGCAAEAEHDAGTVTISGGKVTATGGELGAGIGGGDSDPGCTVNITGGEVIATGGDYSAGIGGGCNFFYPDGSTVFGGTVTISGGRITATGSRCAAGIGGGAGASNPGGEGAILSVSGGTVFAIGGEDGGPGIGGGVNDADAGGTTPNASGTSTFTGGTIRIDGGYAANDPTNGTNRVWCVSVPELTPNAAIEVTSLGTYGVNDLFADNDGKLYLWLPNNNYNFTAEAANYEATVADANTTATLKGPGTGIDKLNAYTISLYPNPVQNILHIKAEEAVTAIRIYSMDGTVVTQTAGENISEINLTHLAAGIYMVRVETGERGSVMKMVKK